MMPLVSVVVCTFNREKYLEKCLTKLRDQSSSRSLYEVLIVNNNSTDNTEKLAEKFIQNNNLNFKYFNESNQGHSFSRNRGIREATGDIITFIDDDSFVDKDFIKNISSFFSANKDVAALGGRIFPVFEGEIPKWMSRYLMPLVSALDMGNKSMLFTGRKFPIGANMSFRKQVFEKYGIFNVDLGRKGTELEGGDEKEIFLRLKAAGEKIMYVPDIVVEHIIPQKRVDIPYIKGLGIGVGTSERKRIREGGLSAVFQKIIEETTKIGGTVVLFFIYLIKGNFAAGWMLIRFRLWVLKGLIFKK